MPIVDYPMRRFYTDEEFTPYLSCRFINPKTNQSQDELALIDTGANACTVSAEFAKDLGHNIKKGIFGWAHTASDRVQRWQHTFTVQIFEIIDKGDNNIFTNKESIVLTLQDISVDALDCNTPILLGVRDFLEKYTLIADYPAKKFSIRDFRTS